MLAPRKKPVVRTPLARSTLAVFDVPVDKLVMAEYNANVEDEQTFDQLTEGIKKDGFDEPLIIIPYKDDTYLIVSGHHRYKAAKLLGHKAVPCVVKEGWDEDKAKIESIRRNKLRGEIDPVKFTALFNELKKKGYDEATLKLQMSVNKEDVFKRLYKDMEKSLNPAQRRQLAASGEKITSIDGLSGVLNQVFKEHGSELDNGFITMPYGGKTIHYVETDKQLHDIMTKLEVDAQASGVYLPDLLKSLLANPDLTKFSGSDKVRARQGRRVSK